MHGAVDLLLGATAAGKFVQLSLAVGAVLLLATGWVRDRYRRPPDAPPYLKRPAGLAALCLTVVFVIGATATAARADGGRSWPQQLADALQAIARTGEETNAVAKEVREATNTTLDTTRRTLDAVERIDSTTRSTQSEVTTVKASVVAEEAHRLAEAQRRQSEARELEVRRRAALNEALASARGCIESRNFDCAMAAANRAHAIDPGNGAAASIKRQVAAGRQLALDGIQIE